MSSMSSVIGKGSFGTVVRTSEDTVIKTIKIIDNKNFDYSAVSELCVLSTFSHPHMNTSLSHRKNDANLEISMPYGGITLTKWTEKTGYLQRIESIPNIAFQLLSVLAYLEKFSIAHSDIKPDNILIDENLRVTLIDWGSAALNFTTRNYVGCTHITAAPEQFEYEFTSNKSDVFSLGMTIKFLIHGKYDIDDYDKYMSQQDLLKKYKCIYPMVSKYAIPDHLMDVYDVLALMLFMDPSDRPSASRLVGSKVFFERFGKPIKGIDPEEGLKVDCIAGSKHFTETEMNELTDWMKEVCFSVCILDSVMDSAINILNKYLAIENSTKITELQKVGSACLLLSQCLYSSGGEGAECIGICDSADNCFDVNELHECAWKIGSTLGWKLWR